MLAYSPRPNPVSLRIGTDEVVLRDQAALKVNSARLAVGFTLSDLVLLLNQHVFFWPGTEEGPSDYGLRHAKPYQEAGEPLAFLRAPSTDLFAPNTTRLRTSRYNSGSPRSHKTAGKSPRGPDLFKPPQDCDYPPGEVVEVVFSCEAALPSTTMIGESPSGPWRRL